MRSPARVAALCGAAVGSLDAGVDLMKFVVHVRGRSWPCGVGFGDHCRGWGRA